MSCTYEGCDQEGTQRQSDDNAIHLCEEHHKRFNDSVVTFYAGEKGDDSHKRMVAEWIRAQGGVSAAFARILSGPRGLGSFDD